MFVSPEGCRLRDCLTRMSVSRRASIDRSDDSVYPKGQVPERAGQRRIPSDHRLFSLQPRRRRRLPMNLLLIDDHPLFSIGFAHAVNHVRQDVVVLTAESLERGLALASLNPAIDIALIDYRLGRDDGLAGIRRFGLQYPLVARVLISGNEDAALAARARAAGASAFLGKSMAIAQMLAALQKVCAGGEHFGARAGAPVTADGAGPTARQLEVLTLIGQGRQNKQIADELGIAERTVKLHITALFDSLSARNRTHLLVRARELGLS